MININLNCPLTLGKLRELINNGSLSKFPDDIHINMCINWYKGTIMNKAEAIPLPVLSVVGNENEINFYNYI